MRAASSFALVFAAALAACGVAEDDPVAAKVNGHGVPISSVRSALERDAATERGREATAERGREASTRALERVIDQELLVQAALDAHLERDPRVAEALDSARRHVLAQAYIDRASAGAGDSNADDVAEFYRNNPALFSARRIYRFQELAVEGPTEKVSALQDPLRAFKTVDDMAAWLRTRNVSFSMA